MVCNDNEFIKDPRTDWGGTWTEKKLDAFAKYVKAYLTILKRNPYWETVYFDGFAGSGERRKECENPLYAQLQISIDEEKTYKGSAERILSFSSELSFDYYYFIDSDADSLKKLEGKLAPYPKKNENQFQFKLGDCNNFLGNLANALNKKKYAALIFLDPFGMQVRWESIENLKGTRSDIWILVPTGLIVNRLLNRNGELKHSAKLQSFFGLSKNEILDFFYRKEIVNTLFGEQELIQKIEKPIEKIAMLYIKRLSTIWDYVTEKPLKLINSKGVPIFHFVFASNNVNAKKIANQIIQNA
jgi:three-Cys-motif partner protein